MDDVGHQDRQDAPEQGGLQADISVNIVFFMAVIPVADFEQAFHRQAGQVFQGGGAYDAGKIGQDQIVLKGQGDPEHHNGSAAVKGQERDPEKAAVDRAALEDRYIGRFKDPSKETIEIEKCKPLVPGVCVQEAVLL